MCGIIGIIHEEGIGPQDKTLAQRMCNVIVHRGPDDEGFFFSDRAGLGIRRLSIIDLQTGHQPVFNEDQTVAVVLNGEIYNYQALHQELVAKGHKFSTSGDTETIVHLYEEYGDNLVGHLRGMFCFALWDERRKRLLLARDRIGIKQVYYAQPNGRLIFGSEIKCLLESPDCPRELSPSSLLAYLTYLYVPPPATIYRGISELPPAHYLTWQDGRVDVRRYWQLEYRVDGGHSEDRYIEGLRAKLADAVKCHLVSDVPLGAFLSGGIDSGSVVALMTEVSGRPAETFTVGFEGDYGMYDERQDARLVADRYRSHHHEFVVKPNFEEILPRLIASLDQPLADSSAIPNYYICQLARQHVTVALSGMGGDELTGGYERYLGVLLGDKYRKVPAPLRRALLHGVRLLPDVGGKGRFSAARLKRFVKSAERDAPQAYLQLLSTFDRDDLSAVLAGSSRKELRHFHPEDVILSTFQASGTESVVNQMLFADFMGYLPGDLLPMTDRMSMAHSLEVRVPLLDHELVEYVASIPPEIKIRGLTKKYILRQVARKLLPEELLRKGKRGFSIPLAFWFRRQLKDFVLELLSPSRIGEMGCFDPKKVTQIVREHMDSRANHENKIWALAVFSLWHDTYVKRASASPSSATRA